MLQIRPTPRELRLLGQPLRGHNRRSVFRHSDPADNGGDYPRSRDETRNHPARSRGQVPPEHHGTKSRARPARPATPSISFSSTPTPGAAAPRGPASESDQTPIARQCRRSANGPPRAASRFRRITKPRHGILADPEAVLAALGFNGSPAAIGLPANARDAERLVDPKAALEAAANAARGRRRRAHAAQLGPAIAARQSLARLRQAKSFAAFEGRLCAALADIGCL